MTDSRCLITSVSNKYFPALLNLLGSIKHNYPDCPHIYVYDLGLSPFLRRDLAKFKNVTVLEVPPFVPFWRSCYTWKTYILNTPLAEANFYVDAGCQVLRPLSSVFEKIESNGYMLVSQGKEVLSHEIVPKDYAKIFDISPELLNSEMVAAGIFGFKKGSPIKVVTEKLFNAGRAGLSLGFSQGELWKNRGKNKNTFIRDCPRFRHDTTLLTIFVLKYINHPILESLENFEGHKTGNTSQLLWNLRMNYAKLEYADTKNLSMAAKIFLWAFMKAKRINAWIKSKK